MADARPAGRRVRHAPSDRSLRILTFLGQRSDVSRKPFGAAEALLQELRARRENELKLVLSTFESFERIADIGMSHHPGPRKIRGIIRGYLRELFQGLTKLEDEDEHENEAVARMNIDNYFSKFATKRPNGAFCNIFGGYRHSAPDYFRLRFKSPGHGFTVDQDQKAPNI
jgi:hypothetical protein